MKNKLGMTFITVGLCSSMAMAQTATPEFNQAQYKAEITAAANTKLPVMMMADLLSVVGLCGADVVRSTFTTIDATIAMPPAKNKEEAKVLANKVWENMKTEAQLKSESSECRTSVVRTSISFTEGFNRSGSKISKTVREAVQNVQDRLK